MSRQDLTDDEKRLKEELRRGVQVARMPDSPRASSLAGMYRQRIPTGPVKPAPRYTSRAASLKPVSSDARVMQMRGRGMEQAAQTAANQGYTVDDVVAAIQGSLGGGSGGGGGGGRGGGGVSGPSRKDIDAMIKAMTEAASASQTAIGGIYSNADKTLAELTEQYGAAQAALGAGAGRTLGAFGVADQQMNPMGMSAGDYLTATRGTLSGLSAAQLAQLEAQKAAYALLASDLMNR